MTIADEGMDRQSTRKIILAGAVGNVMEWYDFAIYGFFASVIGQKFFPGDDPTASLIAAFGVFAAGYMMRPLGSVIFGHIGDKIGRKRVLIISVVLMAGATFLIGLLPTTAQIGDIAAVLLVTVRLVQGISVGGEFTGSIVFLVERAGDRRRGFFGTFSVVGAGVGTLLGSATAALMANILTPASADAWGWRIPFLAGILLGVVGLYLRQQISDAPEREPAKIPGPSPVIVALKTERWTILRIALLNLVHATGLFMIFIYAKTFFQVDVGIARSEALNINTISTLALLLLTVAAGALSDRIGRKPLLIASAASMIVFAYPLFWLMDHPDFSVILAGQLGFALIVGAFAGVAPATMAEMLPG